MDDTALVIKAQNGDQEAFNKLWKQYRGQVFWYCNKRLRNADDAEDLTMRVFERAWNSIGALREPAAFRGWLFCIASNLSLTLMRVEALRGEVVGVPLANAEEMDIDPIPTQQLFDTDYANELMQIARSVCAPVEYICLLGYYRNDNLNDCAVMLGFNHNTLRSHILRGRQKLLAELFSNHQELLGGLGAITTAFESALRVQDRSQQLTLAEANAFKRRVIHHLPAIRDEKVFRAACMKVARWLAL